MGFISSLCTKILLALCLLSRASGQIVSGHIPMLNEISILALCYLRNAPVLSPRSLVSRMPELVDALLDLCTPHKHMSASAS